jgi:squalene-hopene/tetraprenyl-beta-curcumene cyclase
MRFVRTGSALLVAVSFLGSELHAQQERDHRLHQYHYGTISIPPASPDEPTAETLSFDRAVAYVEDGAKAWVNDRGCVTCHTTGWYGILRPQLTESLGEPDPEFRAFLGKRLGEMLAMAPEELRREGNPGEVVHITTSLASWDAYVEQRLSPQTEQALQLMFSLQQDDGAWHSLDTWPPFESDRFQLATVAAMAVGMAPGWLEQATSPELRDRVSSLREYLARVAPPHDYGRVALLWAEQYFPDLIGSERKQDIVEMILDHQRPDGGWSIRSFSEPEQWGRGNRGERLRAETDFADPSSDGHQTGLAVVVLTSAGLLPTHPAVQRGVAWLDANQRQSGRWWTKSLNTDRFHFITYTGTLYPVMALTVTGSVPSLSSNRR